MLLRQKASNPPVSADHSAGLPNDKHQQLKYQDGANVTANEMNIFETTTHPSGDHETDSGYRRVELQSPADLKYIIANVSRAAREKIDKHLPPDAAPEREDAMRKRVAELVDDYIKNTFTAAKDSMSINGMDSREMEAELAKAQEGEEIEPFDTKVAQRLQALAEQIDHQTLQLANLRKNAPAESARKYRQAVEEQEEFHDDRVVRSEEEQVAKARDARLEVGEVERVEEMEGAWMRGLEAVAMLRTEVGSTVTRLEKAQKAVEVLKE